MLVERQHCLCAPNEHPFEGSRTVIVGENTLGIDAMSLAKLVVSTFIQEEPGAITDDEIRTIAASKRIIGKEGSLGLHQAIALCYIAAHGEKGKEYCIASTRRSLPGCNG